MCKMGGGSGLVLVDHRSSVRGDFSCERGRSLGRRVQVEGYQFDMLGNRKQLQYYVHQWHV